MTLKFKIIFLLTFVISACFGQTSDTVINNSPYNYVDKWAENKLRAIGNYKDNLKQGFWTYFHRDGTIAATGKYKDGKKTGKWKYNYKNLSGSFKGRIGIKYSKQKINWDKKTFLTEQTDFDERNGYYILVDNDTRTGSLIDRYLNGKHQRYVECKGG